MGQAVSHEAGHAFGLTHQREISPSGDIEEEYHSGDDVKGYIMGDGGDSDRPSVWHNGTIGAYQVITGATVYTYQDDMAVIARSENGFGYRPDDFERFGNDDTHELQLDEVKGALVIKKENVAVSGVIEHVYDHDVFAFENTAQGEVEIRVFNSEDDGNLRMKVQLFSAATGNTVIASEDSDSYDVDPSITVNLNPGRYYVGVSSYGEYSDVGQYSVEVREKHGPRVVDAQMEWVSLTQGQMTITFNKPMQKNLLEKNVQVWQAEFDGMLLDNFQTSDNITHTFNFERKPQQPGDQLPLPGKYQLIVSTLMKDQFFNAMDQNGDGASGDGYVKVFFTPTYEALEPSSGNNPFEGYELPSWVLTTSSILGGGSGETDPTQDPRELLTPDEADTSPDRYANGLVRQIGTTVAVAGTEGNDSFEFSVGRSTYELVVNGIRFEFNVRDVAHFVLDAGPGEDRLKLAGSAGSDVTHLRPTSGEFSGDGYRFEFDSVETVSDMRAFELTAPSADFDVDGDIDGFDFLAWQRGFGIVASNATRTDGNADDDLDVDAVDLGVWEGQYGLAEPLAALEAFAAGESAPVESPPLGIATPSTPAPAAEPSLADGDLVDLALAVALEPQAEGSSGKQEPVADLPPLELYSSEPIQRSDYVTGLGISNSATTSTPRGDERQSPEGPSPVVPS